MSKITDLTLVMTWACTAPYSGGFESVCLSLGLPCQGLPSLLCVLLGLLAILSPGSRRLTCLPSLGLHACSVTGEPGETEVEVAVRHFPCCWMRWSLNSHACRAATRKAESKRTATDGQMCGWVIRQIYYVFW